MQTEYFDVDDEKALAEYRKLAKQTFFGEQPNEADDEPQKMSSQVARPKPIRHQAVDILRAQNGGYRPSEDNIQAEIVRLSAMQHIAMSLQPGTTKIQDGKAYVLNENHRWTRPDLDDGIDAYDTQGVLDFVAPPRKQGDQNVFDFTGGPDAEESDKQEPEAAKEYELKTDPLPVTQIAPNGKEYSVEYAPGDLIFDQSSGVARVGRVVGYTEDPGLAGSNLLVQFEYADKVYVSPNQVLGEADFGRGREKGTWKDAVKKRSSVKLKGMEYQVTNRFTGEGHLILKKGGLTFEYGTVGNNFQGNHWFIREVDGSGSVSSWKDGKFSKIDPVSKKLGVPSLDGLRWLQTHDPANGKSKNYAETVKGWKEKAFDNLRNAFKIDQGKERFESLRALYLTGKTPEEIKKSGVKRFPSLNNEQLANAKKQTDKMLKAVDKGYNAKAKSFIAALSNITLFPNNSTLSLFVTEGKTTSIAGAHISRQDDGMETTGYEPRSSSYFISGDLANRLKKNSLALTPDQVGVRERLKRHLSNNSDEAIESYIKAAYPADPYNDNDQEHTWLHEFGHAIDGPYHVFSHSDEWKKIFKKEIVGKSSQSRLESDELGFYSVKQETKIKDLKPGDKLAGSKLQVDEHYQDKDGNLTIKEVIFNPETKTQVSHYRIIFEHHPDKPPADFLQPIKNEFGDDKGLLKADAPDGAPAPLSMYARTNPAEGWAEFAALLARRPDKAKELFPQAYRFWKKKGLV